MEKYGVTYIEGEKVIKLIGKEIKKFNGGTFTAFQAVKLDKKLIDVRFKKTCRNIPTETCIVKIRADQANIDYKREYPVMWIHDIIAIYHADGETAARATTNIEEIF